MTNQQISHLVKKIKEAGKEIYLVGREEPGIMIDIEKDEGELMDQIIDAGINEIAKTLNSPIYLVSPSEDRLDEIGDNSLTLRKKYLEVLSLKDRIRHTPLNVLLSYSIR